MKTLIQILLFVTFSVPISINAENSRINQENFYTELAIKLAPGQKSIVDGVIIQNRPDLSPTVPLTTELPLSIQKKLNLKPVIGKGIASDKKRFEQRINLAKEKAAYKGRFLSKEIKATLIKITEEHIKQDTALERKYRKNKDYEKLLKQKVVLLTGYLLDKSKLFEGNEKAQIAAYGRKFSYKTNSLDVTRIEKNLYRFISGEYFQDTKKSVKKSRPDKPFMFTKNTGTNAGINTGNNRLQCKDPLSNETRRTFRDTEEETYYGVNIWVAEFNVVIPEDVPIIGDFFQDNDLVHTSIVTEINRIKKYRRDVVIYNNNTVIGNKYWYVYKKDRLEWGPANGCAYKYYADDRVRLASSSTFNSLELAKKYAYRYTPPFKVRTSAYSAGCYGSDWICHTSCNAFAYRRWGLIVFNTFDMFGTFGKRGISPDEDSCGNQHNGCVPGKACYYQTLHAHNTCPPGCGVGPIAGMKGDGYKLSTVWNTVSQRWEASGVRYNSLRVPDSLIPSQFEIEYCPTVSQPVACRQDTQCPAGTSCVKTPVNGVQACPALDANVSCICIANQTSGGSGSSHGTTEPEDYWEDLWKNCQDPADCGGNTWCMNSGICGRMPETCIKDVQCPMGHQCGYYDNVGGNLNLKNCTFELARQGKCRCESSGPAY